MEIWDIINKIRKKFIIINQIQTMKNIILYSLKLLSKSILIFI